MLGLLASQGLAADMAGKVQTSCVACHSLGLVCEKLGGGQAFWEQTVVRMKSSGADVAGSDIPAMAAWLAGLKPGQAPFCK
jgi:mono/diheme cytochrome c family protein